MNTRNAELDCHPSAGPLHLHPAQRWVGFLGGLVFFAVIVLGVWGIQKWEQSARAKAAIAGTTTIPSDHIANVAPPVPTFVTAGLFNVANPEPQARRETETGRTGAASPGRTTYPLRPAEI